MSSRNSGMPVQKGALAGGAIFVIGLIVTFVLAKVGFPRGMGMIMAFDPIFGSIFGYSAFHLWPMILGSSGMGSFTVGAIVPIVLLLGSGFWVASESTSGSGFMNGASVTVGYFVLALLAFLYMIFTSSGTGGGMQIGVDFVVALVVTGIVFPVVFGGIGGVIADSM